MRSLERFRSAWVARDWNAVAAVFADGFRESDRRTMMHLEVGRDAHLAGLRPMFTMHVAQLTAQVISTRGDRLALARGRFAGAHDAVGPSEADFLFVIEVDGRGLRSAVVLFDADDLVAATAELDARYSAGEAAPFAGIRAVMLEFRRAFAARDWAALAAILSPELEMHDHRPLGWEPSHGPQPYIAALRSLVDLAPDVRLRLDHGEMCRSGYLSLVTWAGTHEGGVFEAPSYIVGALDAQMRARRFDQYDLDQLHEALARFAALRADAVRTADATSP